jgi:predicted MPP superfamily phosphohydrolase
MESAVYNGAMTVALVTAVWVVRRHHTFSACLASGAGLVGLAGLLAVGLGDDAFSCLKLLAYGLFLHAGLFLAGSAACLWKRARRTALVAAVGFVLVASIAADAFLIEPHWLEVSHVRVASSKLSRPVRMAIVADLQANVVGDYERRTLALVLHEKPDLILLPGDFIQERDDARRAVQHDRLRAILQELGFRAPMGAYAVGGNADAPDWPAIFDGTQVTVIEETGSLDVGELRITGLAMRDSFFTSLRIEASERFQIVFGHAPDFALGQIEADLLVAGHTHGGQVRLPWFGPIMTRSSVPRNWAAGVTDLGVMETGPRAGIHKKLIVSRGIGMERAAAPRLRFLCRPQIVVVELVPLQQIETTVSKRDDVKRPLNR